MMAVSSLEVLMNEAYEAACKALDESVQEIFTESTNEYCPTDTGAMKASAKNELVTDSKTEHVREISYNKKYAIYVHERVVLYHKHGSAKFLAIPIDQNKDVLVKNMVSAARDALGH